MKRDISQLSDYKVNYNVDKFMLDLEKYFEKEADLNLVKIRGVIEKPGKLMDLIERAKDNGTHPVIEFVRVIFKDLAR